MTSELNKTNPKMTASTPKEHQHNPSSTNCPPVTPNPYNHKKTYKQALLAEVEGANNRTGMDTFKLVHLVQKQKQADESQDNNGEGNGQMDHDVESVASDNTTHRTNGQEWYTSRFHFQITHMETQKETYMDDLISQVNQVLEVLNLNTPGVKPAPWHTESAKSEDLWSELSDETMEAIKYLYGFKAGMTRPGAQYFRINLAIPSRYTPDDVERKNKKIRIQL